MRKLLLGLVALYVLSSGCSDKKQPPGQQPAAGPPVNFWEDGRTIQRIGDVQVQVARAHVAPVRISDLGRPSASAEPHLIVTLYITNLTEGRRIDFEGWGYANNRPISLIATCSDNVGNVYRGVAFGFGSRVAGQQQRGSSLYPGKALEETLVFEQPVDVASQVRVELPGAAIGEEGAFKLSIPTVTIEGHRKWRDVQEQAKAAEKAKRDAAEAVLKAQREAKAVAERVQQEAERIRQEQAAAAAKRAEEEAKREAETKRQIEEAKRKAEDAQRALEEAEAREAERKRKAMEDPRPVIQAGDKLGRDDWDHYSKLYGPADKEGKAGKSRWKFYEKEDVKLMFNVDPSMSPENPYAKWVFSRFLDASDMVAIDRAEAEKRLSKRAKYRIVAGQ